MINLRRGGFLTNEHAFMKMRDDNYIIGGKLNEFIFRFTN